MSDQLQRFLFENLAIRGELVHLDATWRAALEGRDYPPVVRGLLGEAMAAAALLAATLKFDGSLTLQVQGDGPIPLLVVEASAARTVRGLAHWQGEVEPGALASLFGSGRMVITLDPGMGRERYQGVVELEGASLADAIDNYLARSEQLDTRLWLVADAQSVAGLLVQKLPEEQHDEDAWNRVLTLGETISDSELLKLEPREIIHRLFHEEDIRLFEAEPVAFRCSCSREKVADALHGLGYDEVMDILSSEGTIEVNCEFCNRHYSFDAVDAEQIFAAERTSPGVPPTLH